MMNNHDSSNDLTAHWLIVLAATLCVAGFIMACQFYADQLQLGVDQQTRVLIRTVFYIIAIIIFPFTTLLRHILLRLNQTMPGDTPARLRYLLTVLITQGLIGLVAIFGLIMFVMGDGFNTLYIFSAMAGLGIFLQRPKLSEVERVALALSENERPESRSE